VRDEVIALQTLAADHIATAADGTVGDVDLLGNARYTGRIMPEAAG